MSLTRRQFLGSSGAAIVAGTMAKRSVFGANDRINLGFIGCGSRGRSVTGGLMSEGAQLTYLCDLRQDRLDETWAFLSHEQEAEPAKVHDMHEVFAADDVDAVVIGTPDHWHAVPTVWACQAGKDVFVEKPASHNIFESQKMVEAAEKYGCIVQLGTQNRSAHYMHEARERIQNGELGDIALVKVYNLLPGGPFHLDDPTDIPNAFVDGGWDTWLGRTPREWPYHSNLFRAGWKHFWEFTGGDMADDGIHQIDAAFMVMGDRGTPRTVGGMAGRYVHTGDDSERPDVQVVNWDFGDHIVTFELSGYPSYMRKTDGSTRAGDAFPDWRTNATRIEIYGSDRFMYLGRHGGGWVIQEDGETVEQMAGTVPDMEHYRNFLDCVRSREKPTADIAVTHASNVAMHMANIAHRLGNVSLNLDQAAERFDSDEANTYIDPPGREEYSMPAIV